MTNQQLYEVFKKYSQRLFLFARRYVSEADAEEIVSESFVRFWKADVALRHERQLEVYLYKTVRNECLRHLKNNKVITVELPPNYDQQSIIYTEIIAELYSEIEKLPPKCKVIFKAVYMYDRTVRETATMLHISTSAVKTQLARGVKLIRSKLNLPNMTHRIVSKNRQEVNNLLNAGYDNRQIANLLHISKCQVSNLKRKYK